jgi:hypothetical protein
MKSLTYQVGSGLVAAVVVTCFLLTPNAFSSEAGFDWDRSDQTYLAAQDDGYSGGSGNSRTRYLFPKRQKHLFFSIQFGERSMEGDDFEGETYYASDTERYLVPNLEPATFYGLMVEGREDWMGYQIGYTYAKHEYSWLDIPIADATTHFIDFNFMFYAMSTRSIQPFGMLGFSLNGIRIQDGKIDLLNNKFLDSSMYGAGLNYGVGVDYYLGIRAKLTAGARWHYNPYNSISGQELDEGLDATGHQYYVSVGLNTHR